MQKRIVSGIMLTLLLIGMLTLAFQIQPVKAGTITVPDDYPTIQQAINNASEGDTIYVHSGYYAEDVVVDKPVSLIGVYFPALRSFKVVANNVYTGGFCLQNPGVFPYGRAIVLDGVKGCIVSGVIVNGVDEGSGIVLEDASNNIIANCTVWGLPWGGCIQLVGSSNNTIFSNTIDASYGPCIYLENSSDNDIFHNNFYVYYVQQVEIRGISINVWDNGYPSGGNYWSDYTGLDLYGGPYQNETWSDGIGDTPYVIDANNIDHYPLMNPTSAPIISGEVRILKPEDGFVAVGSVDITFNIINMGDPVEFKKGYAYNRIDLEIEFIDKAFGVQVWSTFFDGLTLDSGQTLTKTVTYDATSQEVYEDVIIRIVHWKYNPVTDGYEFGEFGMHEIRGTLLPPLSVSISPLSASILVGQSVTFTSTVSGGYTPYSYQWYLNGAPVSGATSDTWTFTPTTSGIYYVYLKVTDAKGNTAQSDTARITVATVPVGGYSFPIQVHTKTEPVLPYIALVAILTAIFTKLRPKTRRKR